MINEKYTYKIKWLVFSVVMLEVVFWTFSFLVFKAINTGITSATSDQLLFKSPEAFNLLYLIIPISITYLYALVKHNKQVVKQGESTLKSILTPVSSARSFTKYFLFRNAVVLLIIALTLPIYGKKTVSGSSDSLELVVSLDISNSMNTRDISSNISRLDISKRALTQLVNNLHGEKIGICLFANSAFVQLPLTRDYAAAKLFIQEIESGMISSQGTNIAEALEVSVDMFSKEKTTKGIILVTDGENHEKNPSRILEEIKKGQIQLSVLGIGTKQGGPIPKNPKRPELGYKTDALGKTVISRLNPSFVKGIAQKGGGKYSISSNEFPNLSALLTQINQMKRTKISNLEFDVKQERFQIPLFLSLLFWLTYIFWSSNFKRMFKRVN